MGIVPNTCAPHLSASATHILHLNRTNGLALDAVYALRIFRDRGAPHYADSSCGFVARDESYKIQGQRLRSRLFIANDAMATTFKREQKQILRSLAVMLHV